MTSKTCYIMGLPEAGKTTFLAALAYSLQQGNGDTKLKWLNYNGDHQYLLNLMETWLQAYPADRTNISAQEPHLTIDLLDENDKEYRITFPDLSGEIFQQQYKDREIDFSNKESICNCDGIMLFVNPIKIQRPELISSLPIKLRDESLKGQEHDPLCDPTEVQLVELLQFVKHLRNKPVSLTVIISAWDIVEDRQLSPEKYAHINLTLLWQFLYCNTDMFKTIYFGVSAQGGSLEDEESQNEILKRYELDQTERIKVIDNYGSISHDISLPLWETLCNN